MLPGIAGHIAPTHIVCVGFCIGGSLTPAVAQSEHPDILPVLLGILHQGTLSVWGFVLEGH